MSSHIFYLYIILSQNENILMPGNPYRGNKITQKINELKKKDTNLVCGQKAKKNFPMKETERIERRVHKKL